MRRFLTAALMISLLLTGCGENAAERKIEQQRDALAAGSQLSFRADLTAAVGDDVFCCTLDCAATADEVKIEVVSPELIAGITARLREGEAELEYDGVRLSFGTSALEGLKPVSAIPLLCKALKAGHVIRAWTEKTEDGALVAAEIYADENYGLTVWFDSGTLTPLHAELSRDGAVVVSCDFSNFKIG